MGKNIYIGDIHGLEVWKDIVKEHKDADNIIFVGDYFDSFNINGMDQLRNTKDIIDFKKLQELDPNKKVYLLIGNHDHHYWPGVKDRGSTAGYQAFMYPQIEEFFRTYQDIFQMAVIIGDKLCTHAGVSSKYIDDFGYWTYDNHKDESNVANWLNDLLTYQPNKFLFTAGYDKNNTGFTANGYGDDEWQCPIWIRPKSLQRVNKNEEIKKMFIQIVGHTQQKCIDLKGKTTGGRYYYIDTLPSGEYLIEEDNKLRIGKI